MSFVQFLADRADIAFFTAFAFAVIGLILLVLGKAFDREA